jgi:adenine deaminase
MLRVVTRCRTLSAPPDRIGRHRRQIQRSTAAEPITTRVGVPKSFGQCGRGHGVFGNHLPAGERGLEILAARSPRQRTSASGREDELQQRRSRSGERRGFPTDFDPLCVVQAVKTSEVQQELKSGPDIELPERRDVPADEPDADVDPRCLRPSARPAERLRNVVDAHDVPSPSREIDGPYPGAAAEIERRPVRGFSLGLFSIEQFRDHVPTRLGRAFPRCKPEPVGESVEHAHSILGSRFLPFTMDDFVPVQRIDGRPFGVYHLRNRHSMRRFIHGLPKAELHIHIEGSLEPELMFEIAKRNAIALPFASVEEVRKAYQFENLQSFLDLYYRGAAVLVREQDFYDLAFTYLRRAAAQNVRHTEIFFDPQTHTDRGVPFETVIEGLSRAREDARDEWGISSGLILCFLRHLSADAAMETLERSLPFRDRIVGVGLDSSELGHPPSEFQLVFDKAADLGLERVAHAGEEGPPGYIWEALDGLGVARIDHGVRCLEDPKLVARLRERRTPLTVCPLSNVKLRVFDRLEDHNLKALLDAGLCATVNSDDPAYFGGYIQENYEAVQRALRLERRDLVQLARNAFEASFLTQEAKDALMEELDDYLSDDRSA